MTAFRRDRYLPTLFSGYGLIVVQIFLALAMVPLALAYLGKESFGVWAVAAQVSVWFQLLDGGMNGAVARFLIDYRDQASGTDLRKCLTTGFRVLCVQGFAVLAAAILFARFGGTLFDFGSEYGNDFSATIVILGFATCIGFVTKIIQAWLYATERIDISNGVAVLAVLGEFLIFWILITTGHGILSLAWARLFSIGLSSVIYWFSGVRLANFPMALLLGGWDTAMFKRLMSFAGGMFLLTLGTQLFTITQTAMVAKSLGLGAAAVWATAPKMFQVVMQMVSKLWDYRVPRLSSFMAEGRKLQISAEFKAVFKATSYVGGGTLGAMTALNGGFLEIWTKGAIHWSVLNDCLMAISIYSALLIRCVTDFVLHTKKVGLMPILMLCEGVVFVFSATWLLPKLGISGMLCAAITAGGILRLPYAWTKFREFFGEIALDGRILLSNVLGGMVLGGAVSVLLFLAQGALSSLSELLSLAGQSALALAIVGPIAFRLVVRPLKLEKEL